jgi:hypothetical protein
MPVSFAKAIYSDLRRKHGVDTVPEEVREQYFDTIVHSGPSRAKRILMESHGDPDAFRAARISFLRRLVENDPSQGVFMRGWLNRVRSV